MSRAVRYEDLYPVPSQELLRSIFVDRDVRDIEGPAPLLDKAVVRKNCHAMLETAKRLGIGFRAHVKTHKTTEVTRLQIGDNIKDEGNIIVSTLAEAEQQYQLLTELHKQGRRVNMLYGIPPSAKAYARLKPMRDALGPDSISFLIDHPVQLHNFILDAKYHADDPVPCFVKVDVGYHRAGLEPNTKSLNTLLEAIAHAQRSKGPPHVKLIGFYGHTSLSYNANSPAGAMQYLAEELDRCSQAAKKASELGIVEERLTISVGATPQTASAQNLSTESEQAHRLHHMLQSLAEVFHVELHAGNYAILDMQQLSTHSRPLSSTDGPTMTHKDIAFRVMAEVLSVYTERDQPEALIGAGTLALGREPCQSYPGWGVVAPTLSRGSHEEPMWDEESKTGWTVGRISQEHGVLTWSGPREKVRELRIGEKITIFPNHACVSAAGFSWFLVTDSSGSGEQATKIVDVWVRCRGW
ncbi:MAG: hypothetical protein Q9159_002457 [Coniocarpon cinnabarinum]